MRDNWESDSEVIKRIIKEADYIALNKCTVRAAAKHFHTSKSTIHLDCTARLQRVNEIYTSKHEQLYNEVQKIFKHNAAIKHINGGQSTKNKAAMLKGLGA